VRKDKRHFNTLDDSIDFELDGRHSSTAYHAYDTSPERLAHMQSRLGVISEATDSEGFEEHRETSRQGSEMQLVQDDAAASTFYHQQHA
jgi:hypothetical protein